MKRSHQALKNMFDTWRGLSNTLTNLCIALYYVHKKNSSFSPSRSEKINRKPLSG